MVSSGSKNSKHAFLPLHAPEYHTLSNDRRGPRGARACWARGIKLLPISCLQRLVDVSRCGRSRSRVFYCFCGLRRGRGYGVLMAAARRILYPRMITKPLLKTYWIECPALRALGFGVTAFSRGDAFQLLRASGYPLSEDDPSVRVTEGVEVADLDRLKVVSFRSCAK